MFDRHLISLKALNSLTKYPSIPTYHQLDPRNGGLLDNPVEFTGPVIGTEKIDGCLVSDTKISMADGSRKRIIHVKPGDEVLGVDEAGRIVATPVTNVFNNGPAEEWMKVKGKRHSAGRGSSFYAVNCTPNHRFWLPDHSTYRAAEELRVGDRITMIRSELELAPCQSSVLLGKLLGDGHLARSKSGSASVTWGHRAADAAYVDWTLRALGDIASPALRTLTSGYGSEIRTGRSVFHPAIAERFGSMITPGGKVIPEWVADALDPIALAFWYMDDGSLSHSDEQEDRASIATNGFSEDDCKVLLSLDPPT
jgi:recombination protein RecA